MKYIFKIMFIIIFQIKLFGTGQIPDMIIYKGDTLLLHNTPLCDYPDKEVTNIEKLFNGEGCTSSNCCRGYVATWEIIDNTLYLIKITSLCYIYKIESKREIGSAFSNLKELFPDRYEDGKVKADWVSGNLYAPHGKLLWDFNHEFSNIFEKEFGFTVENGVLIDVKLLDNSKTRKSKYDDNNSIIRLIYNNINNENLPKNDTVRRRVYVQIFTTDDNGKPDSVRIVGEVNKLYDNEIIKAVRSLTGLEVMYRHGERVSPIMIIPLNFNVSSP